MYKSTKSNLARKTGKSLESSESLLQEFFNYKLKNIYTAEKQFVLGSTEMTMRDSEEVPDTWSPSRVDQDTSSATAKG